MGEIPNQQQLFQPTPSPDLKEIREALSNPDITSQRLHDILKSIDPIMADRWHSNDIRKIKRSIEVFLDTGGQKRYSDILMDQQPPIPRYELLIFWLHADLDKLAPRLDNRIDSMITSGLFSELDCLSKQLTASKFDYSHGILQAIGFKEFHAYRIAKDGGSSLAELKEPLSKSVESMKSATRKYARRQINWIRGKLLPCCSNIAGVDRDTEKRSLLYLLDGTNLNQWDEKVYKPSIEISGKFFSRQSVMPDPISLSAAAKANLEGIQTNNQRQHLSHHSKRFCAVCQKSLQGESEWKRHLQSRNHRKAIKIQNSPQWQHYQRLPEGESRAATTP
jgi:tRNA dimethylallyltransferase